MGLDLTGFEDNGIQRPISRVTLKLDDENVLTAGDDSGFELIADCPHATQAIVNSILAEVRGFRYQMYDASDINIDPSMELGDGITASGVYSVISRVADDGSGFPSASAPGEAELEDEYPTGGPMTQEFNRKIAETRSRITKTAEEIRLEVEKVNGDLVELSSSFSVELGKITGVIQDINGNLSKLEQSLGSISLSVSNGSTSSTIKLLANGVEISSQNISMSGLVTFQGLSDGTTTINGGCIKTGTIEGVTFLSKTDSSSVSIQGGRMHLSHGDTDVGYIGTTYWANNPIQKGITFDLNPYGSYMAWATKASVHAENYTVKLMYAADTLRISSVESEIDYSYLPDRLYFECDGHFRKNLYIGSSANDPAARLYDSGNALYILARTSAGGGAIRFSTRNMVDVEINENVISMWNNIDMHNNSILNNSDERLKTNIEPSVEDALNVIKSIKTYSFDWIVNGKHENMGFIAQQLEAEVNCDFVSINQNDGHYSTKDLKMIPYLVKAIQQLLDRLEALEGSPAERQRRTQEKAWNPSNYTIKEKRAYASNISSSPVVPQPKEPEPMILPA